MAKTICIVDNDPEDRFLFREAILESGLQFEIVEIADGQKLLRYMQEGNLSDLSLLIIDLNMPGMNGIETVSRLRLFHSFSTTPVIMMSMASDSLIERAAYQAGVNYFITKPQTFTGLKHLISQIVAQFVS